MKIQIFLIFQGSCLKQSRNFYSFKYNNFFILYELDTCSRDLSSNIHLKGLLIWRGVKSVKTAGPDKCVYSGYGI